MGNTEAAVPFDNILTTLWGLVAFGGFVTGLLTPRADIYYDRYVQTVKEGERLAARRWWLAATVIPAGVLFLVVAAFIGARLAFKSFPVRLTDIFSALPVSLPFVLSSPKVFCPSALGSTSP